ncbi:DsbE family thiol:disulfide interchange protein [Sulfitobacter guttiformis]|uniref:Cytochrome c biogenesis protein CcmG/thiol:disulfide interchange protein DsbE n=1 Tax=Sulfitobacter guttiformis TaxID=74349 RepID=A0A420DJB1_9RHOB|nr:DsbE family thiol:disulfide interchange protein [Sulfitobacter guttiformis]KIN71863.1 Thiol:disulfide interchange protein [Sulfitobacter guttiformis KCTC 32187]RKE94323.1 cytochrome c biogenesis protein CcmG/thiol:disulfide interchange protein DsbE [Sulfitobacter guttiformis]
MSKISPLMVAPPLIFAAFVALAFFGMFRDDPNGIPSTLVGQMAPGVPERDLVGFPPATNAMLATGEVTLVNFWASWCPPCRAEHPKLLEMKSQGVNIIGINFKDTERAATQYLINDDNPFAGVGFDPQGRKAIDWGVTAPPETFILDGDGTVLFRFAGPLIGSDYEQRFLPVLQAAQAEQ